MRLLLFNLSVLMTLLSASTARAEVVYALTDNNQLVNFDTSTPGTSSFVSVTGLVAGDFLSSIDSRPLNGDLYGFAVTAGTGRLYTIDRNTGAAALQTTIGTALSGNFFGVDFNPSVDRLRVVSDTGQNLRINVDSGVAITDTDLQFAAGDANAGTTPQVIAAAYSNNFAGAPSTTLYTLDLATQSLLTQSPPNSGTLNTVGSLSGVLFPEAAFDISGITGVAYAILNGAELSQVNLLTGETTSLGFIDTPGNIIGFAAPSSITAVPEPSSAVLLALGMAGGYRAYRRRSKAATSAA